MLHAFAFSCSFSRCLVPLIFGVVFAYEKIDFRIDFLPLNLWQAFACSMNLIGELYFTKTSNIFNHFFWFLTAFDKYIKISVLDLEKLESLSIVILH